MRSAYRTTAVVDWLALEIEVARPTQFHWLQNLLADHFGDDTLEYIRAVDAGAGNEATRFLIKLNDAHCKDVDTIRAALAALGQRHTLVGPVLIKELEVSLDFYPNDDQARADLLPLVARLQMSIAAYGRHHRQVGPSKWPDFLDSTRTPDPQQTFYVNNNKRDPVSWRVYHKITDQKLDLPRDQHRARVEFTLRGAGLHKYGINSLDDLVERGFVGFGDLLHFRQFIPMPELIAGMKPELAQLVQHATRRDRIMISLYLFGRHAYHRDSRTGKPRNGGRPKLLDHSRHTERDDELNHLVRDRLRDLTRRFSTQN
ncbi:hypothetical protein HAV22_14545 [Massilia sp. TW-1]|uniref:Uncharacterized protein n=1 Tax=Telluria antibiotica TaxID=2717319 RepID=A0ABX0PE14_9BURK|nr:hypothetical protein [Telluria antibiotica]NIA54854.1 hypothetical protein [Telluria antibiotica]